ncbi:RND transporter [Polynucleobacter asymbioticus]|uniref:efflux transporter outer membrane subunit n=1 Tax=Polynucleobacter asymbioticus TaxID=576611 RepID=UPI0008FB1E90|nr:efflux transporter outer membrane subunit [Polynucleobacter asymbioticus]APC05650.1 RND transporter [Polynucleobacter asymbioticus]
MRLKIMGTIAACLVLDGCALAPKPTQDEIIKNALTADTKIPSVWKSSESQQFPKGFVANDWLKSLNDPTLEAIVLEAIKYNPDLVIAAERVRVAQQSEVVVGAALLPSIGAVGGGRTITSEGVSGLSNSKMAYIGAAWEIDVWGRFRSERAAASEAFEATAMEYANARQSLAATVARAWYTAIEAHRLVLLSQQRVKIYGDLLNLVEVRVKAGKDTELDLMVMRANVDSAQAALDAAEDAYSQIRRSLELLLGRYPAAEIAVAKEFPELTPLPNTGAPAELLNRRPDVIAAEKRVLASFRRSQATKLALLPSFRLTFLGGDIADPALALLKLNPWLATGALGAFLPIYEGGALRAQIEIASAQQSTEVARYGSAVLKAFSEVEGALYNEQYLMKRVSSTRKAALNRATAVDIATIQYKVGKRDLLWVANLQNAQLTTDSELIRDNALLRLNRIALLSSLGGGYDSNPSIDVSSLEFLLDGDSKPLSQ